jgi:hypothetical protein
VEKSRQVGARKGEATDSKGEPLGFREPKPVTVWGGKNERARAKGDASFAVRGREDLRGQKAQESSGLTPD